MNHTPSTIELEFLSNRSFDEIAVGDQASLQRTLTAADIQLFAALSGDLNPTHLDAEFAASTPLRDVVAHGMWAASLISAVLGTRLPGPGTTYLSQTLEFLAPVRVGDTLTVTHINNQTFTPGTPITLPSGANLTVYSKDRKSVV